MICQECKERPATLYFTKIIDGQTTIVHLCEKCAQEKGEIPLFEEGPSFSFNHLLAGILNFEPLHKSQTHSSNTSEVLHCHSCKMTFKQFMESGNVGCPHCYKDFHSRLMPLLKRLHSGNVTHTGKVPTRIGGIFHLKKQIQQLRELLYTHIEKEEFEQAAVIRDEIRSLEKEIANEEGNV